MYGLLLAVIYLTFISLGLPDSLLGAGWPVMQEALGVPLSYAGILTTIIACGTVVSSLFADRLVRKLGSGWVTAVSVLLSALSLLGFSLAPHFAVLCVLSVPYGLSAGAIDAVLNNYVALHYAGKHMSWLHCFWGVGAAISPTLMGICLSGGGNWRNGYGLVFLFQIVIALAVFFSLPLWRSGTGASSEGETQKHQGYRELLSIRGVKPVLAAFFCYCALETTTGLWASSYFVQIKHTDAETAARFGSLFYFGITAGRLLSGFLTDRLGDKRMIRIGCTGIGMGLLLLLLPVGSDWFAIVGLVLIGLGCAPIYPSIIHATPYSFGAEHSQAIIGLQMASAYVGNILMPPLFGVLAEQISVSLYPLYLLLFGAGIVLLTERKNRVVDPSKGGETPCLNG